MLISGIIGAAAHVVDPRSTSERTISLIRTGQRNAFLKTRDRTTDVTFIASRRSL
jgi:hypothetical protein